ncbi:NAD(P)/FAD-dependent oxidoreductase [Anaerocolumna sp.]|uniref:NAD(P)/FAD-dependent oxidoreductase n=1 Tax=Anaerocolumna sp. TaxID=2041569 RepID=UPI0028AF48DE|nr:FAD-dependent oxidoreductase [Anaerocolumna sp.]
MSGKVFERKLNKKLERYFPGRVWAKLDKDCIRVSGELTNWEDVVRACRMCVSKDKRLHVVNDIKLMNTNIPGMRIPKEASKELEGMKPDVLIIGGGISGASIARELSKWDINILLVEKEADLAMQASGRNDGEVHPGVDLSKGSLKQHYVLPGNKMFDKVCEELDVPFKRRGQYACFKQPYLLPLLAAYSWQKKHICGVKDTRIIGGKELRKREPELNDQFVFALYNSSAGCVCPYGLTIAYAENAVQNGAKVSLNTAVMGMEIKDNQIISVKTNKGVLYPKLVINAAGTFAEDIAAMAKDRFYSIHPRKGTNSIMDKKAAHLVRSIASIKTITLKKQHTKGGGILRTVHENLLVGPNAIETYEKENFTTERKSIEEVFSKQKLTAKGLSERDIITYFTGVRAATFEEDFVIEKGRNTKNLIHCAGIQSPGLTTAPAVALDIEKMVIKELSKREIVTRNRNFNPRRKGIPVLREMSGEERTKMIQNNPDYGIIICRCEEVSKGEIIDALNAPISVPTVDGIKRRVRPGMGRCQGGFCMPLVTQIISEHENISIHEVKKSRAEAYITLGETKGGTR